MCVFFLLVCYVVFEVVAFECILKVRHMHKVEDTRRREKEFVYLPGPSFVLGD
ncbi:hypothetical protein AtNW77_Chr1g0046401 [Arabidopsis thaliana]